MAAERQELLIAELNHRVRNILGLVRGLIRRRTAAATRLPNSCGSWIAACSHWRAHTITSHSTELVSRFLAAVAAKQKRKAICWIVKDRADRDRPQRPPAATGVFVHGFGHARDANQFGQNMAPCRTGPAASKLLSPSTIRGRSSINWTEAGGPPVKPPERRGFGSTIVERTVPFRARWRLRSSTTRQAFGHAFCCLFGILSLIPPTMQIRAPPACLHLRSSRRLNVC